MGLDLRKSFRLFAIVIITFAIVSVIPHFIRNTGCDEHSPLDTVKLFRRNFSIELPPIDCEEVEEVSQDLIVVNGNGYTVFSSADSNEDYIVKGIRAKGWCYDEVPRLVGAMQEIQGIDPDAMFLDVGTNIGCFSVPIVKSGLKGVISLEASPMNQKSLRKSWCNLSEKFSDHWQIVPYGVGESNNNSCIYQTSHQGLATDWIVRPGDCSDEMGKRVAGFLQGGTFTISKAFMIKIRTLDDIGDYLENVKGFDLSKIKVMKMDIEGYEPYALRGGSNSFFERAGIKVILVEINWPFLKENFFTCEDVWDAFDGAGFVFNSYNFHAFDDRAAACAGDNPPLEREGEAYGFRKGDLKFKKFWQRYWKG